MNPGDVVLISFPTWGGGPPKLRPTVILTMLPGPYQETLTCGISTQLHDLRPDWDELIDANATDFERTGLRHPSAVRLSFLYGAAKSEVSGVIGRVDAARLARLRNRLSRLLAG